MFNNSVMLYVVSFKSIRDKQNVTFKVISLLKVPVSVIFIIVVIISERKGSLFLLSILILSVAPKTWILNVDL